MVSGSGFLWHELFSSGGSIIIFDEPTSAIDPKAEAYLFDKFYELSKGQASIMITHRLGGLKHVNRIIVLASGELVEDGNPEELLKKEGYYSYLYNTQKKQYY
ncbi:ABC transporter ATP-binding protein [Photorhabdus temperata]|uniref:ABC transporter ATP-binding protein n=1 Tax=Photorhabdus temperata TaxID=574560 RepID=UPI0013E34D8E|nr:ABC transporter ATP-binding protein [Photorhabdus temperata]